ncbi:hypothetical protein [Geothrix sp. PMB-07]|uniref:hypothetical protein n=1 Tax=Geothrix sp. PMB-07 TaxID=3068640 RepID=UPI0027405EEE|nr:hypothetical protein [Geothrix sp. PMB-07]WLT32548.1 hypothetical protein Q9293_04275 [Geothrix sp. PMB-07]
MSDPRPADQPQNDALRARLEAWLNRQNQALLEEVMASWQKGLDHFRPDAALIADLQDAVPVPEAPAPTGSADQDLAAALDLLEGATSQSDLLKRLLDGLAILVERSAIFILKQGLASVYAHRGFEADTPQKPGSVLPPPELEGLIHGGTKNLRRKGPAYSALLTAISGFEAADVALFPLLHKRRPVAVVLVDSGLRQKLDHPEHARALVLAASAMLGLLAATKEEEPKNQIAPAASPNASGPTQIIPEPIEPAPPVELDAKARAAAERLARVLVGDVELYFPAKVAQARAQGDLYRQLRAELERSRATFVERFGEEVENRHRIFTTTLIQLLCDGDASKLGAAPWA